MHQQKGRAETLGLSSHPSPKPSNHRQLISDFQRHLGGIGINRVLHPDQRAFAECLRSVAIANKIYYRLVKTKQTFKHKVLFMEKFGQKHLEQLLETAKQNGLTKTFLSSSVTTNWIVFTGTYSAGKTTLVKDVAKCLHICCYEEPARAFIEKQLQMGRTKTELWADVESTVLPIHDMRVGLEDSLDRVKPILLDTAVPDTLPYALLYGVDPEKIVEACGLFRYKEPVFLVEPLPFESDEIRASDAQVRLALHYLRKETYTALGYPIVRVPVLEREERREFVLRYLYGMLNGLAYGK